jgi:hypothetical protein
VKKISGQVLVKESNIGIPNLVVAAYDSDTDLYSVLAELAKTPPRASDAPPAPPAAPDTPSVLMPRVDTGGPAAPAPVSPPVVPVSIDAEAARLPPTPGIPPGLLRHLGKRLGSVLTDQNGVFVFSLDELRFQGNEERPDLMIVVFAPEDIYDGTRPYPWLPERRILYISSIPREDSGAEETYVIRLLQAQLTFFGIPTITGPTVATPSITIPAANAQKQYSGVFKDARAKTQSLSAIPLHLRNTAYDKYLVTLRAPFSASADDRVTKQAASIDDVFANKKKLGGYSPASLQLTLSDSDTLPAAPTLGDLIGFLFAQTGGLDLVSHGRSAGPSALSADEIVQQFTKP